MKAYSASPAHDALAVEALAHAASAARAFSFRIAGAPAIIAHVEKSDAELIAEVLQGRTASFEPLVAKYSPRVFSIARRYARRESEVEDIAQEVWMKSFQKLGTFRGEAPFEHWLTRLTVRKCFDFLRGHRRNKETMFSELTDAEDDWLDRVVTGSADDAESAAAARQLVARVLEQLSPAARLVITLLEIEERSIKEIADLTGWSLPLVKVRAFRARAEMKKQLARIAKGKYL